MTSAKMDRLPFEVRTVTPDDREEIVGLMRTTLGDRSISRKTGDYWHWKHEATPFGASYGVCAVDPAAQRIAGLRTLMWWTFERPGTGPVRAVRAVDTATHPDYQRRGIFSALTTYALEDLTGRGVAFVFNTPNQNSLPGYLKMGWKVVARWPVYVRPVRPVRGAARMLARQLRSQPAGDGVERVGLVPWTTFSAGSRAEAASVVASHEAGRTRVGYRTPRDLDYLDWRYGSHPDVSYGVHVLRGRAGLEGFAIARPTRGVLGTRALVVTELFVGDPGVPAIRALLASLRRGTRADYLMAHFAEGTLERQALRRAGFFPAPGRGYTWTARPLNPTEPDPVASSAWDLTLGEMEIF